MSAPTRVLGSECDAWSNEGGRGEQGEAELTDPTKVPRPCKLDGLYQKINLGRWPDGQRRLNVWYRTLRRLDDLLGRRQRALEPQFALVRDQCRQLLLAPLLDAQVILVALTETLHHRINLLG